jgi:hypothetical protein
LKNFWVIETSRGREISLTLRKEETAVVPWSPQLIKSYGQMLFSDFEV